MITASIKPIITDVNIDKPSAVFDLPFELEPFTAFS